MSDQTETPASDEWGSAGEIVTRLAAEGEAWRAQRNRLLAAGEQMKADIGRYGALRDSTVSMWAEARMSCIDQPRPVMGVGTE